MDVYVIGVAIHPPRVRIGDKRLEEVVFDTARAALDDAHVTRAQIDHVTIAACDELDGRSISSMLLAAPAGAYLRDEIKCTDSGLTGLCLGAMRVQSGVFDLGLMVSWSKSSKAPFEDVMRMRCEPFFTRPIGLNKTITDGLFAAAAGEAYGISEDEATGAVIRASQRALTNPRGMKSPAPARFDVAASPYVAAPLRKHHMAPVTDGAAAFVLASGAWLGRHPGVTPLARIAGLGWRHEAYELGKERLTGLSAFKGAFNDACSKAGTALADLDAIELDAQTGYYDVAFRRALGRDDDDERVTPSGGAFAQNPYFCTGLINAAEAALQVAGRAGENQIHRARKIAAHSSHGFAGQGHVVAILEGR